MSLDELLKKAEELYNIEDYTSLIHTCDEILVSDRNNVIALNYKAVAYCSMRQYHLSLKLLNRAEELYPDNYYTNNNKALVYLALKDYETALKYCEKGLKIKKLDWLEINKTEALVGLNRIDEAYEFYKNAGISDYTFPQALISCGKYSKIPEYREDFLSDEQLVYYFLRRCSVLFGKAEYGEVVEVCDEIFKLDRDNEIALGYKASSLKEDSEILACCDYAIRIYPENPRFYFIKAGALLWGLEDLDGAIEFYEKGLSLVGDMDAFWFQVQELTGALDKKADLLIESEKYEEALKCLEKILDYDPNDFHALKKIRSIVAENDISYEPTKGYEESSKLNERMEKRFNEIGDYLDGIEIGEYDGDYVNGCGKFKDYDSIDEYVRDVIICLMESYHEHDETMAKQRAKYSMTNIRLSFEYGEPAWDFAVVYGYSCG